MWMGVGARSADSFVQRLGTDDEVSTSDRTVVGNRVHVVAVPSNESELVLRIPSAPGGPTAFAIAFLLFRTTEMTQLRRIAGWSALPVIAVAALACVRSMNPLFPHGMAELKQQESELQKAIQVGMRVEQVRDVFNARKIPFTEFGEPTGGPYWKTESRP